MEITENKENDNNNNPPPLLYPLQYNRVVNIGYTISICVHISAVTGFKKEVYLKPFFGCYFLRHKKIRHLIFAFKVSEIAGSVFRNKYCFEFSECSLNKNKLFKISSYKGFSTILPLQNLFLIDKLTNM